jgi:hypothetical protein
LNDSEESSRFCSGCFFHATHANAVGADADVLARAIDNRADTLQVWIPAAAPGIVRVADYVAVVRGFAADFTLQCHDDYFDSKRLIDKNLILSEASGNTKRPTDFFAEFAAFELVEAGH